MTATIQNYTIQEHEKRLRTHPVLLYMKGTPEEPLCGFSKLAVHCLQQCQVTFQTVDVLYPDIRSSLKNISKWPTFPQLYVKGELIGGSDILSELYTQGKLSALLKEKLQ